MTNSKIHNLNHHTILLSVILFHEIKHNMVQMCGKLVKPIIVLKWIHWFSPSRYLLGSQHVNLSFVERKTHILFRKDWDHRYCKVSGGYFANVRLLCFGPILWVSFSINNLTHLLAVQIFFMAFLYSEFVCTNFS